MQPKPDQIIISRLEIFPRIGITKDERSHSQRMLVSLVLEPPTGFAGLDDRLELTVDYACAAQEVKKLAAIGERALVETLAEEIASFLLERFPLSAVEVELHKFVLPDAEFVGVRIRREH
jgi:dihydroneopterin aldolase